MPSFPPISATPVYCPSAQSLSMSESEEGNDSRPMSLKALQNVFLESVSIQDIIADHQALFDDEEVANEDEFWVNLHFLFTSSNEGKMTFDGEEYVLTSRIEESGNSFSLVRTNDNEVIASFQGTQFEKMRSRVTLLNLYHQMDDDERELFNMNFDTPTVGPLQGNGVISSGDADGSSLRTVILGVKAGYMHLSPLDVFTLLDVIAPEVEAMQALNNSDRNYAFKVRDFQEDVSLHKVWEEFFDNITFHQGHTALLFIGDCAHDRFSCNKDVDRQIREKLHEHGVIFITGNHDLRYYSHRKDALPGDGQKIRRKHIWYAAQHGLYAKDSASDDDWVAHQNKVFVNAYYDAKSKTLYVHHGLGMNENGDIVTAFGYEAYTKRANSDSFDPHHFVQWMNSQPRCKPMAMAKGSQQEFTANYEVHSRLFDFRPSEDVMIKLAQRLGIRIVHGHNGSFSTRSEHVIAINARVGDTKDFSAVAIHTDWSVE